MNKTVIKPFESLELKIYAYNLPEVPNHEGYIKIGETTRHVSKRIFEQVSTAGLNPVKLWEKKAKRSDGTWFHDKELHRFLLLNGIEKNDFNGKADEWFYFNGTPSKAEELTDKYIKQDYEEVQIDNKHSDYILRNEQKHAVELTLDYYLNGSKSEFLWNAKPRFGKTLTTYDFIRKINATNVLIVTNRTAIANSWFDDFKKFISWQEPNMKFISETDALKNKALTRDEFITYSISNQNATQISFISLQDLKGAKFAGGLHDKLKWVSDLKWDLLVIDEAHEGIDTTKTDAAFDKLNRNFTLHLSGTPFKALANNKFDNEQIFNWSYIDEQEAKLNWDYRISSNPYESMPTLNLFTYQMSKMIENQVKKGLTLDDDQNVDFAFDLNEFFKVKENGKFEYEPSVSKFLDNLCSGKFPFSSDQHRNELNHTFWLLPRVASAKAMEHLLRRHPVFSEYEVVLAAGDGVSIRSEHDSFEEDAIYVKNNEKSFDKVRRAIAENPKTITLSVVQLTTGVTIPEWSAVFMLNNIQSPSLYFQTAFRAQNPYEFEKDGVLFRKENSYIFDFAPDRTLQLFDEFANNLTNGYAKTIEDRKKKIKQLINFFPVIAEDEKGEMHELDAAEVLIIPSKIKSIEVVKRGFMSNLLFTNISGIFNAPGALKEILDKIKPEKNRRLLDRRNVKINQPLLDIDGNVSIPKDIVINTTDGIFGKGIYQSVDLPCVPHSISSKEVEVISRRLTDSLDTGFAKFKEKFDLSKSESDQTKKEVMHTIENVVAENLELFATKISELQKEYEEQLEKSTDESSASKLQQEVEEKKSEINDLFNETVQELIKTTVETVVEKQIEKVEEKKKKTTEDDVRDHLRGFARTIPAFLMAYGNDKTTLANFDEHIDPETFEELTSITLDEFRKLRDGFDYVDEDGNNKILHGVFDEVVFNGSVQEFFNLKNKLSNYFDEQLSEDIFDYIPPQKTNQIFTPRQIVKLMVDVLQNENPNIFSNPTSKFADLYTKSGLYITEIVKRLNIGLKEKITNNDERIKWILENQVYASAPSDIIYNISKNYIFSPCNDVSTKNIVKCDFTKYLEAENFEKILAKSFGDDNLKFDVIIGNPPYQNETEGTSDNPIYNLFMEKSYSLSNKVIFITPARFLFNAGKTPKAWNQKMLSDKHLKVVFYEQKSDKVFPNTDIKGGVTITYRDSSKSWGPIGTFSQFDELNSILRKVVLDNKEFVSIQNSIFTQNKFNLDSLYQDYRHYRNIIGSGGREKRLTTSIFEQLDVFSNERNSSDDIEIVGLIRNIRVIKYINSRYLDKHTNLEKFKVILPKSNGTGAFGEVLSTPLIGNPSIGYTQSFISIGSFDTESEANAALKYLKSRFSRTMLGILKVTQDNNRDTWANVPLEDFRSNSDIDWSQSIPQIDQQLYRKYGLSQKEINFIESKVKVMD